ncbi:MAG: hypothetical protein Q4G47_05210, partial [Lachnospiraceae bacterium]|nr:hypothetical protein [Lachnospiraceae bacterium]
KKDTVYFDFKKDCWVVILDIIAVNLSYFAALILRYYLRFRLVPAATEFLTVFYKFAPIYSVLCVVLFLLFRLYGGMWEYASINDINRIVLASVSASILYVVGTAVLFMRMPITYYAIGSVIQLVLLLVIRYSYRLVDIEKQKIANKKAPVQNVMVVGADVTAKKVLKFLETETALRPVVVVDEKSRDRSVHGLPVVRDAAEAIGQFGVNCVLIADPLLNDLRRNELERICEEKSIELFDYAGFFRNQSGVLPLTDLVKVVDSPASIRVKGTVYQSIEEAMQAMNGRYRVESIKGDNMTIEVKPDEGGANMEDWAKAYKQETGEDVSFF